MNETPETGNTELVLPIICPNCSHELNLGMVFALLDPKTPSAKKKEEDESKE